MGKCRQCGSPLEDGDRFCRACGATSLVDGPVPGGVPPKSQTPEVGSPPAAVPPTPAKHPVDPPQDTSLRELAEKRVKERTDLLRHIGTYVIVNAFLVVIWALTGHGYPWFVWVLAGWGLGLALHIVGYFVGSKSYATRERKIEEEMEKIRRGGS